MPQRRNENTSMIRQEPFAYASSTFVTGGPTYEAWADVGAGLNEAKWVACKHTYDGNNNLVRTQWAKDSSNRVGDFTNTIGTDNVTADLITGLTYV